ncbi:glycosyltransferase family 10 domain-containing protein [uncultured Methanoregula sp.]|uniref:glycosyltransferase family 10 domain-containing protein n=1 Tax=uncultured Methanoregula sp. TaxID=1005933 RepID=UPI002AABA70C|nr:glycosyltransferase family 10 [uncultured Methanoregula sp.]
MITIKLDIPRFGWPLADLKNPFLRQTPNNSGIWGNYQFFVNTPVKECDYWVVFDDLENSTESCRCPRDNTIFITGESPSFTHYDQRFLDQFAHIISSHKDIKHKNLYNYIQGHPWFVNKSYDELVSLTMVPKTKEISLITSNKTFSDGHKKRYEFALDMKEHFGDRLDLFGNGIVPFQDKWDVLAPYKYSIIIENFRCDDWITEKLFDCYLAHSFPFYFGSTNTSKYYNEQSYAEIDIYDSEGSIKKIESILNETDHYQKHLPSVLQAKEQTLNRYNLFPNIIHYIEQEKLSSLKSNGDILLKKRDPTINPIKNLKLSISRFFSRKFRE